MAGLMAGAVLSATLTQGFRLWRADHSPDPARERRAAAATWLVVLGVALVVANTRNSVGTIQRLLLLVPLGAGLGLHPRVAAALPGRRDRSARPRRRRPPREPGRP